MSQSSTPQTSTDQSPTSPILVVLAWLLVGIPLLYGLWQTVDRASALFTG